MRKITKQARCLTTLMVWMVIMAGEILHAAGSASLVYAVYTPANGLAMTVDEYDRVYLSGSYRYPQPLPWIPPIWAPPGPPYGPYLSGYLDGDTFIIGHDPSGLVIYRAFVPGLGADFARTLIADYPVIYMARQEFHTEGSWAVAVRFLADVVTNPLYSSTVIYGHWASVDDMAVDSSGTVYMIGQTGNRTYDNYSNPYLTAAYVTKVDTAGVVHPIRELDGTGYDEGHGIDVDEEGYIYVTGKTSSPDFPVVGGQATGERFVAKLDPSGAIVYSTRLGDEWGDILDITAAGDGGAYLVGTTSSVTFPVTPDALDSTLNGSRDPYLARLDGLGALVYATYLGGEGAESIVKPVFGPGGSLYFAGSGHASGSPLADPRRPGCLDNFVARLDLTSGDWVSTCLPGVRIDALAVGPTGDAYVSGRVSAAGVFPADGVSKNFVARITFNSPPDCSAAFASPATAWPPNDRLVPVSILGVTDPDGDPVTLTVNGVRQDEPLSRQGQPDTLGIGTGFLQIRSDREGKGDGRVYHITFQASDGNGGACTGTVTVCVPHDQGRGRACGDGGPLFNSDGR